MEKNPQKTLMYIYIFARYTVMVFNKCTSLFFVLSGNIVLRLKLVRDELRNTAGPSEDVLGCAHLSSAWDELL